MAAWAPFQGVLWLVWDGASFEVVRELIEAGELPAFQRLSEGKVHPLPPLDPNCQTPPSLASKSTRTASAAHGVTGGTHLAPTGETTLQGMLRGGGVHSPPPAAATLC